MKSWQNISQMWILNWWYSLALFHKEVFDSSALIAHSSGFQCLSFCIYWHVVFKYFLVGALWGVAVFWLRKSSAKDYTGTVPGDCAFGEYVVRYSSMEHRTCSFYHLSVFAHSAFAFIAWRSQWSSSDQCWKVGPFWTIAETKSYGSCSLVTTSFQLEPLDWLQYWWWSSGKCKTALKNGSVAWFTHAFRTSNASSWPGFKVWAISKEKTVHW